MKSLLGRAKEVNWGFATAIAFCLLVWATVLFAQAHIEQGISYRELSDDQGITICYNNTPRSFVVTGLDSLNYVATVAHEETHKRQMLRLGSCEAMAKWYNTPQGAMESEAEAYMTDWCLAVSLGADAKALRDDYTDRIVYKVLHDKNSRMAVVQEMEKYARCGRSVSLRDSPIPSSDYQDVGNPNYAYPIFGYAVYSQGTLLAGHGWTRDEVS